MLPSKLREARIDLDALCANLRLLGSGYRVDLAADAYGHGFRAIAETALDAGATEFTVRNELEENALLPLAATRDIRISVDRQIDTAMSGALYGLLPTKNPDREVARDCGDTLSHLTPVMRLSARVISVKRLKTDEPVSYGYTWRASRDTTLALVGIGYADGISRSASNAGTAFLRGDRPIVGRIAMDVLSLDVGDEEIAIGDEAVFFGHEPRSTEAWAAALKRPPLSVTAGIGRRVPRVYQSTSPITSMGASSSTSTRESTRSSS